MCIRDSFKLVREVKSLALALALKAKSLALALKVKSLLTTLLSFFETFFKHIPGLNLVNGDVFVMCAVNSVVFVVTVL